MPDGMLKFSQGINTTSILYPNDISYPDIMIHLQEVLMQPIVMEWGRGGGWGESSALKYSLCELLVCDVLSIKKPPMICWYLTSTKYHSKNTWWSGIAVVFHRVKLVLAFCEVEGWVKSVNLIEWNATAVHHSHVFLLLRHDVNNRAESSYREIIYHFTLWYIKLSCPYKSWHTCI